MARNGQIVLVLMMLTATSLTFGQKTETVKRWNGNTLEIGAIVGIPEAKGDCSAVECEWWNRLMDAGMELQRKASDKSKQRYAIVLAEGIENRYRVPVDDRPPLRLFSPPMQSSRPGFAVAGGKVELEMEIRSDGSVGDIKLAKSGNSDINRRCIAPQSQTIYLPAVKDHAFVAYASYKVGCAFATRMVGSTGR